MKGKFRYLIENRWFQEAVLLMFAFSLFTMNDWMQIPSWRSFWKACCYFLILYTHAQIHRFTLMPVLFKKHKPVLYAIMSIGVLLVFAWILFEVATVWLYRDCYLYKSEKQQHYQYHVGIMLATFICIIGPLLLFRFYREQKLQTGRTILSNEMQLNSLRSQLNPHFLFNTFNTLYGISLEYPERVSGLIMQVSQMMRYQLESSSRNFVSLTDELGFIESYVQLEQERLGQRCTVRYSGQADQDKAGKIAPMLLFTFIENAFKHSSCTIEHCFVTIRIELRDDLLLLDVANSVPQKKSAVPSTHTGIRNAKERLNILYHNRYQLKIGQRKDEYHVHLELKLN